MSTPETTPTPAVPPESAAPSQGSGRPWLTSWPVLLVIAVAIAVGFAVGINFLAAHGGRAAADALAVCSTGGLFFGVLLQLRRRMEAARALDIAQTEIVDSESRFAQMVEYAPVPMIVTDMKNSKVRLANASARAMFGFSSAEVSGVDMGQFYEDPAQRTALNALLNEKGRISDLPVEVKDRYGKPIQLLVSATKTRMRAEEMSLACLIDVTQRNALEASSRESREFIENVIARAPLGIYGTDLTGNINLWNSRAEQIFGWERSDVLGQPVCMLLPPADALAFRASLDGLFQGAPLREAESLRLHRDGHSFLARTSAERLADSKGSPRGLLFLSQDVSGEHLVRQALAESNQFLSALIESSPIAVFTLDLDLAITSWNPASEALYGWTSTEVLGKALPFVPPDLIHESQRLLQDCLNGKPVRGLQTVRVHKDGRRINVLGSLAQITGSDGETLGVVCMVSDISERNRLQHQYETLLKRSLDGFWILRYDGEILDVNDAYCRMVGYSRQELLGRNAADLLARGDLPEMSDSTMGRVTETVHRTKSGELIPLEASTSTMIDGGGRVFSFLRDLRDRRAVEERMKKREMRFRSLLERSSDILTIMSASGNFTYVSPALETHLGYDAENLLTHSAFDFVHADDLTQMQQVFAQTVSVSGSTQRVEFRFRTKRGEWRAIEALLTNALADPSIRGIISNGRDITQRRQAEEQVRTLALYDSLTGLPNRALLHVETQQMLARARRTQSHVGVMFLDLDRFKFVNDSLGHAAGDLLLQELARRLKQAVREADVVARLGGDEFVVVLPDVASPRAHGKVAEKILEATAVPFLIDGHELFVTPSIGIAVYPDHGLDVESLLKAADTAMYDAKAAGKNTYRFFESSMTTAASDRLALENDLRRGLKALEFELVYQPQVNAHTNEICGIESLVRWRHPTRGLLKPDSFIPVAEETGLIMALGDWILGQALEDTARWERAGLRVPPVAVNISGSQFQKPGFYEGLRAKIDVHGLSPGRIELEITESAFLRRETETMGVMAALAADGFGISIDDFGTGYSSLEYLKRMPFTRLKIDRTFVIDVAANDESRAIVRAIVSLANALELGVVAEGVETEAQRDALLACGCVVMQGYLYSVPVNSVATAAMIGRYTALPDHLRLARTTRLTAML